MPARMGWYMWKLVRYRTSDSSSLASHRLLVATVPITSPIQRVTKETLVNNHWIHFKWALGINSYLEFLEGVCLFVCLYVCIGRWAKCPRILKPGPNAEKKCYSWLLFSMSLLLKLGPWALITFIVNVEKNQGNQDKENLSPWSLEELSWSTSPHVLSQHWSPCLANQGQSFPVAW